jgi:hypothetical protein
MHALLSSRKADAHQRAVYNAAEDLRLGTFGAPTRDFGPYWRSLPGTDD